MVPRKSATTDANSKSNNEIPGQPVVKELLYENYYYDITEWIQKHPGGRIIEYYTYSGEDATIAIQQFHQRSTKKVMAAMKSLKRRPATEKEIGVFSLRHKNLTEDFIKLYKELLDEGIFKPSIPHVILRLLELVLLVVIGMTLANSGNPYLRVLGLLFMTMYFGRTGWIQHEGGHHSFTGYPNMDRFIQKFVWGLGNGMAGSWWRSQHNRHHAMPQRLQRDVDLETLPLIAFNAEVVKSPKDGKSIFIQYQAFLFMAIDTVLVAILWKFYLHPRYVFKRRLYSEMIFMAMNYVYVYYLGFWGYIFVMWTASMYLFGNFSLSHTHLPVTKDSLHWVEYSLLHTTNIQPSWWCDWWMGYLNYQIEHHLFPTMPQFRQRKVVPRIRALAEKYNIPYRCLSYSQAMVQSFSNLNGVAKELSHRH